MHIWIVIRPWTPTPRANFFTRNFSRNQAIIRVFRGFDWLSSVSGLKVIAIKKLGKSLRQ